MRKRLKHLKRKIVTKLLNGISYTGQWNYLQITEKEIR